MGLDNYRYTRLEDIRADMVAESTRSARKIAKQFALDSQCKVGQIESASQGNIELTEEGDGFMKKARVLSTVYFTLTN
ncbi:hypothetical protein AGMMS49949_07240 [Alphaproteobacteria bacterium]|nr:hypothetical protein AGMMS49949_07240 [Alphaproteobacteria bacterium]GHS99597.1 hypothetical protein AGMMS50296_7800 [Alphaproteobacteria bacterium]